MMKPILALLVGVLLSAWTWGQYTPPVLQIPVISSLSVKRGPVAGGTAVVITGEYFTGATKVMFGLKNATFVYVSPTEIDATSPSNTLYAPPFDVNVKVYVGTAQSAIGAQTKFGYIANNAPTISGISPTTGPPGQTVTLTGTNLDTVDQVLFDATAATPITPISGISLSVPAPSGTDGIVTITVHNTACNCWSGPSPVFTYTGGQQAPVVSSVVPNNGWEGGGDIVVLRGQQFGTDSTVTIGGVAIDPGSVTVNDTTSITLKMPVHAKANNLDIVVTSGGQSSATSSADQYSYTTVEQSFTASGATDKNGILLGGTEARAGAFHTIQYGQLMPGEGPGGATCPKATGCPIFFEGVGYWREAKCGAGVPTTQGPQVNALAASRGSWINDLNISSPCSADKGPFHVVNALAVGTVAHNTAGAAITPIELLIAAADTDDVYVRNDAAGTLQPWLMASPTSAGSQNRSLWGFHVDNSDATKEYLIAGNDSLGAVAYTYTGPGLSAGRPEPYYTGGTECTGGVAACTNQASQWSNQPITSVVSNGAAPNSTITIRWSGAITPTLVSAGEQVTVSGVTVGTGGSGQSLINATRAAVTGGDSTSATYLAAGVVNCGTGCSGGSFQPTYPGCNTVYPCVPPPCTAPCAVPASAKRIMSVVECPDSTGQKQMFQSVYLQAWRRRDNGASSDWVLHGYTDYQQSATKKFLTSPSVGNGFRGMSCVRTSNTTKYPSGYMLLFSVQGDDVLWEMSTESGGGLPIIAEAYPPGSNNYVKYLINSQWGATSPNIFAYNGDNMPEIENGNRILISQGGINGGAGPKINGVQATSGFWARDTTDPYDMTLYPLVGAPQQTGIYGATAPNWPYIDAATDPGCFPTGTAPNQFCPSTKSTRHVEISKFDEDGVGRVVFWCGPDEGGGQAVDASAFCMRAPWSYFTGIPQPPDTTPTISGLSPTSGPVNQTVTISGSNLSTVNAVYFGTRAASSFDLGPPLTAHAPSGGSGTIDITVVNCGTPVTCTSPTSDADKFTFTAAAPGTVTAGASIAASGTPTSVYAGSATSAAYIGSEANGKPGYVTGPEVNGRWPVAFDDDLTGWVADGKIIAPDQSPTLTLTSSVESVAIGGSATLTWASGGAVSCQDGPGGSVATSGSTSVTPTQATTYLISCTNSHGTTTRRVSVAYNMLPDFSWTNDLPITFNSPVSTSLTGVEMRSMAVMDGSLYAAIGNYGTSDWAGNSLGSMVLRKDSESGPWVNDGCESFNPLQSTILSCPTSSYLYVANTVRDWSGCPSSAHYKPCFLFIGPDYIYTAHLSNGADNVNVLLVTQVSQHAPGMWIMWKTDDAHDPNHNTWKAINLAPNEITSEARAVYVYTDSVTNQQMIFVGGAAGYKNQTHVNGIYTATYDYTNRRLVWNADGSGIPIPDGGYGINDPAGIAGTATGSQFYCLNFECRVQGLADCVDATGGHHLIVNSRADLWRRTDGPTPRWTRIYHNDQYPPPGGNSAGTAGIRGLQCVENPDGSPGNTLLMPLEGTIANKASIYKVPVTPDIVPVTPVVELNTNNWLSSQLSTNVTFNDTNFSNEMPVVPNTGTPTCQDRFVEFGNLNAPSTYYNPPQPVGGNWALCPASNKTNCPGPLCIPCNTPVQKYPWPEYAIRHCDGTYSRIRFVDPAIGSPNNPTGFTGNSVRNITLAPWGKFCAGGTVSAGQWNQVAQTPNYEGTGPFNNTAWLACGAP